MSKLDGPLTILACVAGAAALALVLAIVTACRPDTTGLGTLTVPELAALLDSAPRPVLLDANTEGTREKYGAIPGAVLLASYRDYDPAAELPPDRSRTLVFYCHSEWCGAAAVAARRAVAAGYADVRVLASGIEGWVEAGRPVSRPGSGALEAP